MFNNGKFCNCLDTEEDFLYMLSTLYFILISSLYVLFILY